MSSLLLFSIYCDLRPRRHRFRSTHRRCTRGGRRPRRSLRPGSRRCFWEFRWLWCSVGRSRSLLDSSWCPGFLGWSWSSILSELFRIFRCWAGRLFVRPPLRPSRGRRFQVRVWMIIPGLCCCVLFFFFFKYNLVINLVLYCYLLCLFLEKSYLRFLDRMPGVNSLNESLKQFIQVFSAMKSWWRSIILELRATITLNGLRVLIYFFLVF